MEYVCVNFSGRVLLAARRAAGKKSTSAHLYVTVLANLLCTWWVPWGFICACAAAQVLLPKH